MCQCFCCSCWIGARPAILLLGMCARHGTRCSSDGDVPLTRTCPHSIQHTHCLAHTLPVTVVPLCRTNFASLFPSFSLSLFLTSLGHSRFARVALSHTEPKPLDATEPKLYVCVLTPLAVNIIRDYRNAVLGLCECGNFSVGTVPGVVYRSLGKCHSLATNTHTHCY